MPASSAFSMPPEDVQCAQTCLPNLCASSVIAENSSMLNDGLRWMTGTGAAASCGYLDEVSAFLDELPDGGSTFSRSCSCSSEVGEMSADDSDGSSG